METLDFIQQNLDLNDCNRDGEILLSLTKLCMLLDDFCELQEADSNTKPLKKGSYVTRAAYAKLQGENKRLIKDIQTLVMPYNNNYSYDKMKVIKKWRETFKAESDFDEMLRSVCRKMKKDDAEQKGMLKDLEEFDNHPQL